MAERKPLAEYEKDGVTKQAWTPTEQVDLEFHGWKKKEAKASGSGSSSSSSSTASGSDKQK